MNLLKAALSVSAVTLVSRITGLAREVLTASTFGAGAATDAFFVAFRIPNLLRRFFAEGAFSQGFVPVLAEHHAQHGLEAARELAGRAASLLTVVVALVTLLGMLGAPILVYATAARFAGDADKFALTVYLLRWVFPYIFFISLVSLAAGVLNTLGHFKGPAFTPVLLNLAFIAFIVWVAPNLQESERIHALAWAAFVGGALQLAWQGPMLWRARCLPRWQWAPRDPGVLRMLKLMAPATLGVSVAQISLILNTQWAAAMGDGAVSWLSYADRLMEFPTALLGVALGTVILPSLVRQRAAADAAQFSRLIDWGLRLTVLLALPAAVGLAMLGGPLIATIFWHGEFAKLDVIATRWALWGYAAGLVGLIAIKVLAPGFYAQQNVATPMKVAVAALVLTQLANVVLLGGGIALPSPARHAVLAATISLGALFNAGALWLMLRRAGIYRPEPHWGAFLIKVLVALYMMGGVLWFCLGGITGVLQGTRWFSMATFERVGTLAWMVPLAALTYFGALALMGIRLGHFRQRG
jgi:putative peptidoglycan lipid II flippase